MSLRNLAFVATIVAMPCLAVEPPSEIMTLTTGSTPLALVVNPTVGRVFALCPEGQLTAIDELSRKRSQFEIASDSSAMAVNTVTGLLYITGRSYPLLGFIPQGQLTVLDPETGERTVIEDSFFGEPAVNSTTNRIYVSRPYYPPHTGVGLQDVAAFEGETLARHNILVTGPRPDVVAIDETHDQVYVGALTDTFGSPTPLTIIDGPSERTSDVALGCQVTHIAVDPARSRAWAGCLGTMHIFMVERGALAAEFLVDAAPTFLSVNLETGRLYAGLDGTAAVVEISRTTELSTVRRIPIAEPASGLAVNSQTNSIYASQASAGTVVVIDGETHEQIDVPVGLDAAIIAVDATRDIAWVATTSGVTGLFGSNRCGRCTHVVNRP